MMLSRNLLFHYKSTESLGKLLPSPEQEDEIETHNLSPRLTIIDATTAMEGEGPIKGELVDLGLIIAGNNVVNFASILTWLFIFGYAVQAASALVLEYFTCAFFHIGDCLRPDDGSF